MTKTLVRGGLRNRRWLAIAIGLCVAGVTAVAWGFWSPGTSAGSGSSNADTVNGGATPTASATGRTVTVSWGASTLAGGGAVDGYIVKRYDANTDALKTILSDCTGTVAALTCDEHHVSLGAWKYTVTPVIGDNWHGAESAKSGTVTVTTSQSLSLTKSNYGIADFPGGNATVTGTASGFSPGENLTYKLDDPDTGTTLSGTPSSANGSGNASISLTLPQPSDGAHSIWVVGDADGQASEGIVVDTVAPTVDAQLSPAPNTAGWNDTSPVSVTLSADDGTGSGIKHIKYTTDGSDPLTSGTATTYSAPFDVSTDNTTVKYASTDNADNNSTVGSKLIRIDTTAPDFGNPALTISESNAFTFANGSTVYYNPQSTNSGSFTVHAPNLADGGSGIDKANFPSLSNMTGGGDVSRPGPYDSTYSWTSSSNASGSHTVTATNVAGLQSTSDFTTTPDTTAPSVDAPSVTAGYYTTASVPVTAHTATDTGSGVASTILQRDQANLTNNTCGSFPGSWGTTVTLDGTGHDTSVSSGKCFKYRERSTDNVGNQTTTAESDVVKVDTSAPVFPNNNPPPITIAESNPNTSVTGSTLFYNPHTGNSGTFTVTANVSDSQSGIEKVNFPSLSATNMTGGGDVTTPSGTDAYSTDYSWGDTSTTSGSQTVTAYNNANSTSTSNFTVTPDTTAPSIAAPSVTAGYFKTASVPVSLQTATDGGSGVNTGSIVVERDETTLSNGTCGAFPGTFATTVSLVSGNDTSVASGKCYQWRERISDNVGNQATSAASNVAKVDTTGPVFGGTPLTLGATGNAFVDGTTAYYKGTDGTSSSITVSADVTDADSGIEKVNFPALGTGFTGGGDDTTNPYGATYTWTSSTASGSKTVTATNNATGTNTTAFTLVNDTTAPSGGSLAPGTGTSTGALSNTLYNSSGTYTLSRTDYTETENATQSGLASSNLTVAQGTYSGTGLGSCSGFGSETPVIGAPNVSGAAEGCFRYTLTGTDNVGNSTSTALTVIVDKTAPTITGMSLINGGNASQAGQLTEKKDTLTLTFSEPIKVSSICSSWTTGGANADGTNQTDPTGQTITVADGTGATNDSLSMAATGCSTFRFGTIDLGSNAYIGTAAVTFSGSGAGFTFTASTHTLNVALGTKGGTGTIGAVIASSIAAFTPTAGITDTAGNALTTGFTTANVKQF